MRLLKRLLVPRREKPTEERESHRSLISAYLGNGRLLSRLTTGNPIILQSDDLNITYSIIANGYWEEEISMYISSIIQRGDVFIDLGANVGYYTVFACERVKPTGFVVAFEPQKNLMALLRETLSLNGFGAICHLDDSAIGATESLGSLGYLQGHSGAASLTPNFGDGSCPPDIVRIRPLDDILPEIGAKRGKPIVPTIIKMDIEGYEYHAWQGMRRTIASAGDMSLIIEFGPRRYLNMGQDPVAFVDELLEAGFTLSTLEFVEKVGRRVRFTRDMVQRMVDADEWTDLIAERGFPRARP